MELVARAELSFVTQARRRVAEHATWCGASAQQSRVAALLTSEAVFDAVVHGAAGGQIHVVADALGRRLTVSVRHQTRHPDDQAALRSDREQLLMIYLAESWDIANEPGAQVVRFVLAIDGPATRQEQTGTSVHQLARHWAACGLLSCVPQPRCP